ncbi:MAG: hypothetical protein K8R39_10385 [Arcobacteraceae bacterium]|nr:hypothetical protein [Arcobacteraceae bacterium]
MGKIEDKIKQDLMSEIFTDTFKIYEFIDTRFKLEEKQRSEIIAKINSLNNDLTVMLKEIKLS